MKQLLSILLLTFFFSTAFAQTSKKETIVIKTTINCDHCLQCNSCGKNINDVIRETKGISKVKIDPKENTIMVTYKPAKTNPDKIRKAISEAGYDADDIKASPAGYAKLDGCCKAS